MTSMLLEVDILGRDRVPVRNWHRSSVLAKPNEDDEAVSRQFHYPGRGVARSDVNTDMHAGRPGVNQMGLDLDKVTYPQRPIEAHRTGEDRDIVRALGPLRSEHVRGLIYPAHHDAAVNFAAPIDIGWRSQEPEQRAGCRAVLGVRLSTHGRFDLSPNALQPDQPPTMWKERERDLLP
jgi:hypothetical protein